MSDQPTRAALADALAFYAENGVDWALDEAPHDRFAEDQGETAAAPAARQAASSRGEAPARPLPQRVLAERSAPPPVPKPAAAMAMAPDDAAASARQIAATCQTLDELKAAMAAFEGCDLKRAATQLCFADGKPGAPLMIIGEAPGADEDIQGLPFVGRSGQLLDRILAAVGLTRAEHVYIANTVPWRPPGNRTPTPQETAICAPFIARQIELSAPKLLLCLGAPAAQSLLGIRDGILRTRGKWMSYQAGPRAIPAMASLHPAYLLRQPLQKRLVWRDIRAVKAELDKLDG
jgi:uracil-DNA glycosylase